MWSNLPGLASGIFTTRVLATSDADDSKTPGEAILSHWPLALVFLVVAWMLSGLSALVWNQPVLPRSAHTVRQTYLTGVIQKAEKLRIDGLPMIHAPVSLDEIFIPFQLKPHQARVDRL